MAMGLCLAIYMHCDFALLQFINCVDAVLNRHTRCA